MADPLDIHPGMSAVASAYDGFVLDLWGVIHDGRTLYPGVVDCLDRLGKAGKSFVMLSNAPRRAPAIARSIGRMGMPAAFCRNIVSSGEATFLSLKTRTDPWFAALGRRCLHIGPERDENLFAGIDIERVAAVAEAEFIVNTGPWEDGALVSDYEQMLADGAGRGLPMVCANPDLEVIRGGKRIICAGALAARYEALGGEVRFLGKPHRSIYDGCFELLGIADHGRIAAIGDSLRTDIAGAKAAGIDSILVIGGLHGEAFGAAGAADGAILAAACAEAGHMPTAAIPAFTW